MTCANCEAPDRRLWPANRSPERALVPVPVYFRDPVAWLQLKTCSICEGIWVSARHEPFSSFQYCVLWPYSLEDWWHLADQDLDAVLLEWHNAIREAECLKILDRGGADAEAIRSHDARLGRHGPFVKTARPCPDIESYL